MICMLLIDWLIDWFKFICFLYTLYVIHIPYIVQPKTMKHELTTTHTDSLTGKTPRKQNELTNVKRGESSTDDIKQTRIRCTESHQWMWAQKERNRQDSGGRKRKEGTLNPLMWFQIGPCTAPSHSCSSNHIYYCHYFLGGARDGKTRTGMLC